MNIDLMNEAIWSRLLEGEKGIPENWNRKSEKAIKEEKREVEKRYGIRIGQTEIHCDRCGRLWGSGGHTCRDLTPKKPGEPKTPSPGIEKRPMLKRSPILPMPNRSSPQRPSFRGKTGMKVG